MESITWGSLPTEIIIRIFEELHIVRNFSQYMLVNKQWYHASLRVFYKHIYLDFIQTTETFSKWEKREVFCASIKNSTFNVNVMLLSFNNPSEVMHILGLLMKYCPNVKEFHFRPTRQLCDFITSCEESGSLSVWEKMEKVVSTYSDSGDNPYYKCLRVFRDSLTQLCIHLIPTLLDKKTEKENLYLYLKAFTNLKDLVFMRENNVIQSVYDCSEILQCCPNYPIWLSN